MVSKKYWVYDFVYVFLDSSLVPLTYFAVACSLQLVINTHKLRTSRAIQETDLILKPSYTSNNLTCNIPYFITTHGRPVVRKDPVLFWRGARCGGPLSGLFEPHPS